MLLAEGWAPVIIVKHIGGEGSLELISIGVLHHLLFSLLLLLLLSEAFCGAARRASSCGNALLVLICGFCIVATPVLGRLYKN